VKRAPFFALALILCGIALSSASAHRRINALLTRLQPQPQSSRAQTPSRSPAARQDNAGRRLPRTRENFDIRAGHERTLAAPPEETAATANAPAESIARQSGVSRLQRERAGVQLRWSSLTRTPSRVWSFTEPLSPPDRADAEIVARSFLRQNADLFRLNDDAIDDLRVARRERTEHNGVTHLTLQQRVGGIEVFQGELAVHLDREGRVMMASGELIPDARRAVNLSSPRLQADEAVRLAAQEADADLPGPLSLRKEPEGAEARQQFDRDAGFARDVEARLVYFPLSSTQVRLAWEFTLWMRETPDAYLVMIDAERGSLLYRFNLTSYDENPLKPHGLVFTKDSPRPDLPHLIGSPPVVAQEDVPFRASPFNGKTIFEASDKHYDWWAAATADGLISNNTDAHLDRDSSPNQPDLPRLVAADGNFSFQVDLTQQPTVEVNQKASQVNLFYWVNRFHDILYAHGFTEAAGNFQANNFGLGGLGNDAIQADAQDGSGTNNANFSSPRDGSPGRVQMYLFTATPQRDGSLDQTVVLHELTHGVSNRLVGNSTGLTGMQARGMGEGWSDFVSLMLLRTADDDLAGSYPHGQFVTGSYAGGIRRYPYSTNLAVNPLTFGSIRLSTEVHDVGEIWCNTLWEMRAALIGKYGFQEGQRQSLQLVVDGLKLTPLAPTFIDARNAILLADRVNNNGANQCLLWQAFARRGLGFAASTFDQNDAAPVESFVGTPYCNDAGSVRLDRGSYLNGETLRISLGDRNAQAPVVVQVTSSVTGDQENLTLTQEPGITGSFTGTLKVVAGGASPGDGMLQGSVEAGDQINISYNDANTGSGGTAQVKVSAAVARERALFEDTVEQGNQGWISAGAPAPGWAITGARAASPARSWTDSPGGNYANLVDLTLTSPLFDLAGVSDVALTIAHSYDLESSFDFGIVEYSTDDGVTWSRARAFTGSQSSFAPARILMPGLDGQPRARIRFHLTSDSVGTRDGWYVDNIRLIGRSGNPAVISPGSVEAPVITAVSPAFGPPQGGTSVIITGANFTVTEDTTVTFDNTPATAASVLGGTTIAATAPAHAAGAVTVRVSNRNGAAALAGGFTFYTNGSGNATPTLTTIYPASGSTRGGTVVTLIGSNFTPDTAVSFGAQAGTVTFINSNTLRAVTPSAPATGAVDVTSGNGTAQAKLTGAFNYTGATPPTVQVQSPGGGETFFAGGTVNINWRSSDNRAVARHRIALFRNSGGALQFVSDIATDVAGEAQSFAWSIPSTVQLTGQARIRVIAVDDEGAETEAYSGGDFTLARRWESAPSLPAALMRLAVVNDGKYLYAIGGRTTTSSTSTVSTVYRLDPAAATPEWSNASIAPLPTGANAIDAVFLNGKIYVPGGVNSSVEAVTLHQVYDVATNTWATQAALPAANYYYALVGDEARGVYYMTGGGGSDGNILSPISAFRSYDPNAGTWASLPPLGVARYGHKAALIDGRLYVAGGLGATGPLDSCEAYDFTTKQWSPVAPLNRPRRYGTSAVVRDGSGNPYWYLITGEDPATGALLGVEVYDVRNNRWITLDNSYNPAIPRRQTSGAYLGGFVYTAGGTNPTNSIASCERLRLDNVPLLAANQPPVVAVPPAQVAVPNAEIRFDVQASDLGSGLPLTITAGGLPAGANFTTTSVTNNSTRGRFRWTPSPGDVGQTFNLSFTASDGQLGETKQVSVSVVNAGPLGIVNSADYRPGSLAADSIASLFGGNLAVRIEVAQAQPLPLELAGTTVTVNGVPAPLFFVSPTQINFAVPASVEAGPATIIVSNPTGSYSLGTSQIVAAFPAIFTANASGSGDAAALATADGINYQSQPFDVTVGGRPNILVLFGTGFRHAQAANPGDDNGVAEAVTATIDGRPANVVYAGAQGGFSGLDQLNIEIPGSLAGQGQRRVEVVLSVGGVVANRVTIQIK